MLDKLTQIHHIGRRCVDAAATAEFYTEILGLELTRAIVKDYVPSTREYCPFIHVFFSLGDGSSIAFFELLDHPPARKDDDAPEWLDHIAIEVADEETLERMRQRLDAAGVDVIGPTEHGFCRSVYFFDPNGYRLELTLRTEDPEEVSQAASAAWGLLEEWSKKKLGA